MIILLNNFSNYIIIIMKTELRQLIKAGITKGLRKNKENYAGDADPAKKTDDEN